MTVAIYYGCVNITGHYLFGPGLQKINYPEKFLPFKSVYLDGLFHAATVQSKAITFRLANWCGIYMADYTVDKRGASVAVFMFRGSYNFTAMVELARVHFPSIVKRIETAAPIELDPLCTFWV